MRAKILLLLKPLKQFSVPFTGLKIGKHLFDFEIDDNFFAAFEYSLVKKGNLKAKLELDKQETMMILNFEIDGEVSLTCDTCLSECLTPLHIKERQIIKFTEDDLESDDLEIIMINKRESEIDVSELIYEYITVSIPYIVNCNDMGNGQQCDPEMIAKLQDLSVQKREEEKVDPRWDALKKLK